MTLYAAIDLHSNNGVLSVIDEQDHVLFERRLPNDLERVREALAPFTAELKVSPSRKFGQQKRGSGTLSDFSPTRPRSEPAPFLADPLSGVVTTVPIAASP